MPPLRQPKLLEADALRDYAHKVLASRALSAGEMREKLRRKAAVKADIDPIIARLRELGALDDTRFAGTYAERRLENEGFGRQRVLRDLQHRKVTPVVAEKAVAQAFAGTDETQLIENFIQRKYKKVDLRVYLAEQKHLASAFRKLRLAGFSSSGAIKVLRRYAAQADEIEETPEE